MPQIDLNLLQVFDALMELRSVTRVADRLNLTQSAISHSLSRLRHMLGDPLFVRGPRGLQPSARAEQIAPGIRTGLQQLRDAMAPSEFEPSAALRTFTIAAGSYFCTLIVPRLFQRLRMQAPGVSLRILPLIEDGAAMLDRGLIDLALSGVQQLPSRFIVESLFEDQMVWIAARTHPLAGKPPNLAAISQYPSVWVDARRPLSAPRMLEEETTIAPDHEFDWRPQAQEIASATVYDSQTATAIVARSDVLACVPRRMAEGRADVVVLAAAVPDETVGVAMIWHGRNSSDAALSWLRQILIEVANSAEPAMH